MSGNKLKLDIQKFWQFAVGEVVDIEDNPEILSDAFMADFASHGIDKANLPGPEIEEGRRVLATFPESATKQIQEATIPLPATYTIGRGINKELAEAFPFFDDEGLLVDQFEASETAFVYLQHRYCEYFRRVYPGCVFKRSEDCSHAVGVYLEGKLVGGVMPVKNEVVFKAAYAQIASEVGKLP